MSTDKKMFSWFVSGVLLLGAGLGGVGFAAIADLPAVRTDRTDRTDRSDQSDRTDRTDRSDRSDQSDQSDQSDRSGNEDSKGNVEEVFKRRAAELNLPAEFVGRVMSRMAMDAHASKFHLVDGPLTPEPYRSPARQAARARFARPVKPALAPEILTYRLAQQRAEEPLRGFRAPIGQNRSRIVSAVLDASSLTPRQNEAAIIIRQRLAHDGLLLTLARVLGALGPSNFQKANEATMAQLWKIGFPVDLLAFFRLTSEPWGNPAALISSIARELTVGTSIDAIRPMLAATQFQFSKTSEDFRVATESGEEPLGLLRMQIGGGYEGGIIPGDSIDLASQFVAALPDVDFIVSVSADYDANLLWLAQNSWRLRRPGQMTIISEPCPVTAWAQDNGKAGTVGLASQGPARRALLAPRFASFGEIGSIFLPGESYLADGLPSAGIEVFQSPLLFQGGNVMAVREPAGGRRVLLIGEAEIHRNTALGFTRDQVLAAFRVEFGVDAAVVFPGASHHLDIDVTVRARDGQVVAFVNDTATAASLVLKRGISALEKDGGMDAATVAGVQEKLRAGKTLEAAKQLRREVMRLKAGRERFAASVAQAFKRSSSDSAAANFQCFLVSLDILESGAAADGGGGLPEDDGRRRYLGGLRELEQALAGQVRVIEGLGWKIVRVPSMPDLTRSINYLNGIHDRSRFVMPAFGGFYAPLDEAAIAVFQREFGPGVRIVPIICGAMQGHHGAVHCSASAYPKL